MIKNDLKDYVRTIPDFPQEGIMFRDITTVAQDADGLHMAIDTMQDLVKDVDFDVVVRVERLYFRNSDCVQPSQADGSDPQEGQASVEDRFGGLCA